MSPCSTRCCGPPRRRPPRKARVAGMAESALHAGSLGALAGIRHAFFTRAGGVSQGIYASLNGGVGSNDDRAHVAENRARMAAALGVAPDALLSAYQVHSAEVVVAETSWTHAARPRVDAIVTRVP